LLELLFAKKEISHTREDLALQKGVSPATGRDIILIATARLLNLGILEKSAAI